MKITGIYKIQSVIKPERVYIGSSINIHERWGCHLKRLRTGVHHSVKLQAHYNKYGESDLQFLILLGCNQEDLIKTEQYFIDSYKPWFNICQVAYSTLGRKSNRKAGDATALKQKEINRIKREKRTLTRNCEWCGTEFSWVPYGTKGKNRKFCSRSCSSKNIQISPESREKGALKLRGKKRSDEVKQKIAQTGTQFKDGFTPWNKGKRGVQQAWNKGKHTMSDEQKDKLRESNKARRGIPKSEETKEKIRQSLLGVKHTEERKKNSSDGHKGKKHSEEWKQKARERMMGDKNPFYGKKHTEETLQKMSNKKQHPQINEISSEVLLINNLQECQKN